jgi:hypothetical protein
VVQPSPSSGRIEPLFSREQETRLRPSSNLFDKLALRLSDGALIVSDGSNAGPRFLKRFHRNDEISSADAYHRIRDEQYSFKGFDWKCVGYIRRRYGPTLVWRVARPGQPLQII